jgi:hypothetical protein
MATLAQQLGREAFEEFGPGADFLLGGAQPEPAPAPTPQPQAQLPRPIGTPPEAIREDLFQLRRAAQIQQQEAEDEISAQDQGLWDKFKDTWRIGGDHAAFNIAMAKASKIDGPEGDAAEEEIGKLRDFWESNVEKDPIQAEGLFQKIALGVAGSGSILTKAIVREAITELGIFAGLSVATAAAGAFVPTVGEEIPLAAGAAAAGARGLSKAKLIWAAVRGAQRGGRLLRGGNAARQAARLLRAGGVGSRAAQRAFASGKVLRRIAQSIVVAQPFMQEGAGGIYGELRRQGISKQISRPLADVGGFLYGMIEMALSPVELASGGISALTGGGRGVVGDALNKQITKILGRGVRAAASRVIARQGLNFLTEWSEEGAQELVSAGAVALGQRQANAEFEKSIIEEIDDEFQKPEFQMLSGADVVKRAWDQMKGSVYGVAGLTALGLPANVLSEVLPSRMTPERVAQVEQ